MPEYEAESDIYAKKADELFNRGEYEKALAVIRKGLAVSPDSQHLLDLEHMVLRQKAGARKKFLLIGIIIIFLASLCVLTSYGLFSLWQKDVGLYKVVGHCSTPGFAHDVCVSGDYAYVAAGEAGLCIIDVSNPEKPVRVSYCKTLNCAVGVCVTGRCAYIADKWAGLVVIDVSNPEVPKIIGGRKTLSGEARLIAGKGDRVYIVEGFNLCLFDVSEPAHPKYIPAERILHDWPRGICLRDNYVYLATAMGLAIVDFSDEKTPRLTGTSKLFASSPDGIDVCGSYAYVTHKSHGFVVMDVSNPENPMEAGGWESLGGTGYIWDIRARGTFACTTDSASGMHVFDISNPQDPQQLATCRIPRREKLPEGDNSSRIDLGEEEYKMRLCLDKKHAYIAAGTEGLFIIRIPE